FKTFIPRTVEYSSEEEAKRILAQNRTLAVFDDYETYLNCSNQFDLSNYYVDIFFDNSVSMQTAVVSPLDDYNMERYSNVVYFCADDLLLKPVPKGTIYVKVQRANADLYKLQLNRDICLLAYKAVKNKNKFDSVKGVYDKYLLGKMTYAQYLLSLRVFEELHLFTIADEYTVEFNQTEKQDLANSAIYRCFAK
ncbi:MAG: hypothetical protein K2M64_00145, partial [Clostridia bacterium]|nr:hypothetical protein [Clostridia bacterium]